MKRTTIVLSDAQALLLERERRRRGVPATVIIREALDGYFDTQERPYAIVGLGRSGNQRTARDAESILAAEWSYERLTGGAEPPERPRSSPAAALDRSAADGLDTAHRPSPAPPEADVESAADTVVSRHR